MSGLLRDWLVHTVHWLRVLAGGVLLVAFSWEIFSGRGERLSHLYLATQLVVCLLFLFDYLLNLLFTTQRWRYIGRNWLYLLCAIPWLNLIEWRGVELSRGWSMAVGLLPIVAIVMAVYILLEWIDQRRIHQLFFTYLCGLLLFTYLSALLFYDFEGANSVTAIHFGDALWWAGLNLSTAGSPLVPTTAVGKVLSVMLPMAGMLFLPIFTTYIMEQYKKRDRR
ncbi:MAG: two pore domain potassium channel family protein [Alistipes sp.]|nr:two pore domain potassium channel family protein [Alistipes sp.]